MGFLKTPKCFANKFLKKIRNLYEKLTFAAYDIIGGAGSRTIQTDYSRNEISMVFRKLSFRTANRGSILIEFAICMPILIILLFYIHDLVKLKRYYSQTEFVGQQIANMIQNISKNREDKAVKLKDLARISNLAWGSVYPGNTWIMQGENSYFFGHTSQTMFYYVVGEKDGTASCKWRLYERGVVPGNYAGIYYTNNNGTPVRYKTNVTPSEIYPTLKIAPGEEKMIIVTSMYRRKAYTNLDGASLSDKQAFGFYLLEPKHLNENSNISYFFGSVVIFTPKPGLFDPDNPPAVGT